MMMFTSMRKSEKTLTPLLKACKEEDDGNNLVKVCDEQSKKTME